MNRFSAYDVTHTYDPLGNRVVKIDSGDRTTSVYDAANRLQYSVDSTGRTTFTFDATGNQVREEKPNDQITTSLWDYENLSRAVVLPTLSRVTSTFNADKRRMTIETDTDLAKFVYDGENILVETDESNLTQVVYTLEPRQFGNLVSQRRLDGASWVAGYFHFDALGSTDGLTDAAEVITDTYVYFAFGKLKTSTGTTENRFTWVGQVGYFQDVETGEYGLGVRQYLPEPSRFKSEDPAGLEPDANLFRYVLNNAVNLTDPAGLQGEPGGGLPKAMPLPKCFGNSCVGGLPKPGGIGSGPVGPDLKDVLPGSCPDPKKKCPPKPKPGCSDLASMIKDLVATHVPAVASGVKKALDVNNPGEVSDLVDPMIAYYGDLLKLVDTAEECGLMPGGVASLARDVINNAINVLQSLKDLPKGSMPIALDILQFALGLVGLIPGFGNAADILDGVIGIARQDWLGAILSGVSALPIIGIGSGIIALACTKGPPAIKKASKFLPVLKALKKLLQSVSGSSVCPKPVKGFLDEFIDQIDEAIKKLDLPKLKGLPATTAESVTDKLRRYLLDPNHPVGKEKARWFQKALGFTLENLDDLAKQINFDEAKAVATKCTEHGQTFEQIIEIVGANGKRIDVLFVWIRNNDGVVRLVTSTLGQ